MRVWISKTFNHHFEGGCDLRFPAGSANDSLKPLGQFNGNHPRLR